MTEAKASSELKGSMARGVRALAVVKRACIVGSLLAATGVAQAQVAAPADGSITMIRDFPFGHSSAPRP